MKRVLVLSLFVVSLTWSTLPAHAASKGVRVLKATTSVAAAPPGTRVVFQAFATNLGPGTLDLWVGYEFAQHRSRDGERDMHRADLRVRLWGVGPG
jgi:hypothetical protein